MTGDSEQFESGVENFTRTLAAELVAAATD